MQINKFPKELIPEINNSLPFWFTDSTKNQVKDIMGNGITDQAPSRILVEWVTIDAAESRDLDDWIWAEKRKDWWYTIAISIADPTEYAPMLSPIDLDAMNKWTSIYLWEENTIFMLPKELATNFVSLNWNKKTLSQTVQIDYDDQMNVINTKFFESVFYNKNRLDYSSFKDNYFYEDMELHDQLRLQDEVATKLRKKRKAKWIIEFNDAERWIGRNEQWWKNVASRLIEEFMVAANIETAKYQMQNYPEQWVYRNHMPNMMWKKLNNKEMEKSFYSNKMLWHYGLNEKFYTHFTSPLRRYLDFILHRILKAHLRWDELPYTQADTRLIVNKYLNQQLNKAYFLEKSYHFQEKVSDRFENLDNQEDKEWIKFNKIKVHLKRGIETWLKLPEKVRDDIIESIYDNQRWDRTWIIWAYLLSDEKEIIEALRDNLIKQNNLKKVLNAISETKLLKSSNKEIYNITETKLWITIKINWNIVVSSEKTYRWALNKLFDYALNK